MHVKMLYCNLIAAGQNGDVQEVYINGYLSVFYNAYSLFIFS